MSGVAQLDAPAGLGRPLAHNPRKNMTMQPFSNMSESMPGDPMDITSPSSSSMGPPANSSPEFEQGGNVNGNVDNNAEIHAASGGAAMAAAQGPKVVQTAFIHKLYNMLEDHSIQHLISWSNTNESFVMSPSNEFSKVLAQYFKHTNISSFVRQLNMYGFHKVGDVFHSGSPDPTMWEFKHGNGNFKKGDLIGLREIKRRASRHALIHRDSFSGHKTVPPPPVTPADLLPDTLEQRVAHMEHAIYRMNQRMTRNDDSVAMLNLKCQVLTEGLVRCHQWSHGLSSHVQSLAPTESPLYVEVSNMQKEIARQLEMVRSLESSQDALLAGRQHYYGGMPLDPHQPLSPRHIPFDDSRRSSAQMLEPPPISIGQGYVGRRRSNLPTSPRSYGVSTTFNHNTSPNSNFHRPALPPPSYHRPSDTPTIIRDEAPNLARRHTSADIRGHGWPPNIPPLPEVAHNLNVIPTHSSYVGAGSVSAYCSSPNRTPTNSTNPSTNHQPNATDYQHIRDHLAAYEMNPSSSRRQTIGFQTRQPSPPPPPPPPAPSLPCNPPTESQPSTEHVGISWPFNSSNNSNNSNSTGAPSGSSSFSVAFSAGGGSAPKFPRLGGGAAGVGGSGEGGGGGSLHLHSAPATRRSSMASNVHSLLNPAETAEREGEDEDAGPGAGLGLGGEERKRKRLV